MTRCKNCVVGLLGACGDDYCQPEREALVERARQAVKRQGHTLGEFTKVKDYATWEAQCTRCGQLVVINLNPEPNELDIGGEAVTAQCPRGEPGASQPDEEEGEQEEPWYATLT